MVHQGSSGNSIGLLKSNPDGSNLAIAIRDEKKFELFDFDNQTGIISNPITFEVPGVTYGIEFSPDGSLMYVSAGSDAFLAQYDLQAGSPDKIIASQFILKQPDHDGWSGALQLGPDGKIYLTIYGKSFLGVINNPNLRGSACNYNYNGFSLNGASGQLGLPTFIQSYFEQTVFDEKVTYFEETQVVKTNQTLILKNILFDFNKSTLQNSSFSELDKVVKILIENPNYFIEIRGHTDNIGNKSYNIKLSEERARSVGAYLISKGVDTYRISYKGFGSSIPIAGNTDEAGRSLNRRVEFILNKQ
jgi:outer membrane protein OmpA-like peptidoglycan-associated protein